MKDLEDQLEERIQKFEDDIQRISSRPSTEPRELKPTVIHLGFDAYSTDVMVRLTVNSDPRCFENRCDDEDREGHDRRRNCRHEPSRVPSILFNGL